LSRRLEAGLGRRAALAGLTAFAVTACGRTSKGEAIGAGVRGLAVPALKDNAPFPIGCAVSAAHLADPAFADLLTAQVSQLTPEWEMKMEYILQDNGDFRFDAPDAIAAFARGHGLRLFGHNLIWYAQDPIAFHRLDGQPAPFAAAYRNYVLAVAGRYRGQTVGWDVVNEPVAEDGDGLRGSLWSRNLGPLDYMRRAFDHAREADPGAVLLINDYNLESLPRKRATFLRLIESLMQAGAPLGGIGTQCHLAADLPPAAFSESLRDLAGFGLPVHVSELDISLNRARNPLTRTDDLEARQVRLAHAAAEAFTRLPARQRFAFSLWGLRGGDSWLRGQSENPTPPWDQPLPFDDEGRPRAMLAALTSGFQG
jgi:endo-1,4-beta-xylanase